MKGTVKKYTTPAGAERYRIACDLGPHLAQRCQDCRRRRWVDSRQLAACDRCGGELVEGYERRQHFAKGYKRRGDADQALREVLTRVDEGTAVARQSTTVAEYAQAWLDGLQLRPNTVSQYRAMLDGHALPSIGGKRLQTLTVEDVNRLYRHLESRGGAKGEGLSTKTVRHVHVALRRALEDAVRRGYVARNVAALASPPSVKRAQMKVWSSAELRGFLAHVEGDRLYAAWLLLATTGMRRGEVLGLRWSDVDLDAGKLHVSQVLTLTDNKPVFTEPKTAAGRRTIALDPVTVAALREHRRRQKEHRMMIGQPWKDAGLVVALPDGSLINPNTFAAAFRRHVKAAGLPKIRLHDVRHSYATAALAAGVRTKVLSERLGHSSTAITEDVYAHVLPEMDADAAQTAANAILGVH